MNQRRRALRMFALLTLLVVVFAACGEDNGDDSGSGGSDSELSGEITVDGSSTVAPLTSAAAELFRPDNPDVQIAVGTSGTGGGFEKFCAGETDMSDASRPIKDDDAGRRSRVREERDQVRGDPDRERRPRDRRQPRERLGRVPDRRAAEDDLGAGGRGHGHQLEPGRPVVPRRGARRCTAPGTDSGTFDFFTDAINGEEGASRPTTTQTEDDNITVQGVVRRARVRSATSASRTTRRTRTSSRSSRSTTATAASSRRPRRCRTARTRRCPGRCSSTRTTSCWPGPRASRS